MREGAGPFTNLSKLEQDLSAGGRLEAFSISVSPAQKLKWQKEVREPFIDNLLENLQERFDSTELLSSFVVLDPSQMPQDMPEDHGCAKVLCLAAHYGGEVGGIVDQDALCHEWLNLREFIAQNRHLSQEELIKLLLTEPTMAELYPSMKLLASALMVVPVSTADSERAFSTLKRVKTRLRSSMKMETLNQLLTISIDGPEVDDFDFDAAATAWGAMRNRRLTV
ncbi:zinc finger protein 862-like [Branchiostoma floridae x Branchiostoma japonicum]